MTDESWKDATEVVGAVPKGQRIGRYTLEGKLGKGGMADIFLARAEGPGGFEKRVVIKKIRSDLMKAGASSARSARFVEMFLREAKLLAGLSHPNVVRIFELGQQDNGDYFLAMEYLDGLTLRDIAERFWLANKSLPIEALIRILADSALGLEHAHQLKDQNGNPANLVHRDISPDNLFVTSAGITKVLDFGIAKRAGIDQLTQTGELKGKIPFMSPEQLKGGDIDARTDIWSFGVTMYWLFGGRRPFDGNNDMQTMKAIVEDPPPPLLKLNPRLPPIIDELVRSCLEKAPSRRMGSAGALYDSLMTLLVGLPPKSPMPSELVATARTLKQVEHEVNPILPAALPFVPWPDSGPKALSEPIGFGGGGRIDDLPRSNVRGTAKAVPLAPQTNDSLPTLQKISVDGATERVPRSPGPPKRDKKLVDDSNSDSSKSSSSGSQAAPFDPEQTRAEGSGPRADIAVQPTRRIPISDAPNVDDADHAVTAEAPPAAAKAADVGFDTVPVTDPRARTAQEAFFHSQPSGVIAGAMVVDDELARELGAGPSRTAPVVLGVATSLALLVGVLYVGLRDKPTDAVDAGAALVDAGAAMADAGFAAPVVVDAGVLPPPPPKVRELKVKAPSGVEWRTAGGEKLGVGNATLSVPLAVTTIVATDAKRGVSTKIGLTRDSDISYFELPKGKLVLTSSPSNADVFLGATKVGKTPFSSKELVAGTYKVRLVARRGGRVVDRDLEVEITPNKTTTMKKVAVR